MVIRNTILLLTIALMGVACGKKSAGNTSPVFLSRQSSSGIPALYAEKYELIKTIKRHQLILDTDGDGILDKDDADIDNDGIPNDCDSAPFNNKIGKADTDKDGIPDFCDLNQRSDKVPDDIKAKFQQRIYQEKGIVLFEDDVKFSEKDIPFLTKLIDQIGERAEMPNKNLITIALTTNLNLGEYGAYDAHWTNIRYQQDDIASEILPSIKMWQWALTHEFFHFVAAANPQEYSLFLERYNSDKAKNLLIYPTEYSKESADEYFAELETSLYYENFH